MKVFLASHCLGLPEGETKHSDRTWNCFIVSGLKRLAQTVFDLLFQIHLSIYEKTEWNAKIQTAPGNERFNIEEWILVNKCA